MPNTKISALAEATSLAATDLIPVVVDPSGTPITKKITRANLALSLGAWTDYTPTWTADGGTTTLGNGTLTGRYCQIGKLVFAKILLIWNSTTSCTGNAWHFALPVMDANKNYQNGPAWIFDNGTRYYTSASLVEAGLQKIQVTEGTAFVTGTSPMTWTTYDVLAIDITYEAA